MAERTSYGVVLTEQEAEALARRLMARIASDWFKQVDWEVVPELWEGSWQIVAVRLDNLAQQAHDVADGMDRATNIDSRYLFDLATYPAGAHHDGGSA